MWAKLLIVVTCLYAARASVPSIFDNEDVFNLAEVTRTARSCSFSGCNSFCRKLGHARGVCIGTYCQCRFRRRRSLDEESAAGNGVESNEKAVETILSGLDAISDLQPETFVAIEGDESTKDVTVRSCGYAECNSFCRKLGYARGVCIGNYCQCRSRMALLTQSAENQQETVVEDAVETGDKTPDASIDESSDASDHRRVVRAARSCSSVGCTNHCRKLGHARGVCIGSYCQCRSRLARSTDLKEGDTVEDNLITPTKSLVTDNEVNPEVLGARSEGCNLRWCEQNCRRIGFPGGTCVNGRCKCDILRSTMPAVPAPFTKFEDEEEIESRAARRCTALMCSQNCRRLGFRNSRCLGTRCICW